MVSVSPMKAKAMTPIEPHGKKHPMAGGMGPSDDTTMNMMTKPPKMPAKGSDPKSSMYDGPYGGKKPQS